MGGSKRGRRRDSEVDSELELIRSVARRFRTTEPEELEAELARKLIVLKQRPPTQVRDWNAYRWRFLHNKAINWIRDRRNREHKTTPLAELTREPAEAGGETPTGAVLKAPDVAVDEQIAFASIWRELRPELQQLWVALVEERGNQAKVARRIGMHRNTVRLWVRQIRRVLQRHGFETGGLW